MADNEEELVDVNANLDETETVESVDSDESLNNEGEDNTPAKKNKSNWKKMKQENKALKAKLAEYESADESESDDEDDSNSETASQYAPLELKVLFLENPSAKDYEVEIRENLKKYPQMDFDDAFKLAKADKPVSETKRSLSFKSTSKPKDISSLSQEEALKLTESEYLKWARATGNLKE